MPLFAGIGRRAARPSGRGASGKGSFRGAQPAGLEPESRSSARRSSERMRSKTTAIPESAPLPAASAIVTELDYHSLGHHHLTQVGQMDFQLDPRPLRAAKPTLKTVRAGSAYRYG